MTRDHQHEQQVLQALARLSVLTPLERERWYDLHVLGIRRAVIATRDGCSPKAVSMTLRRCERKLRVPA